jgi:Family of unknown function (DUF6350)
MAAGAGLAVVTTLVVIGWIAAPHPGLALLGVLRTAAVLWLAGHHVAVQVSGAGRIGMLPLGLTVLPGALLWRAGRSLVRSHPGTGARRVLAVAAAVAVPYALLAGVLALISRSGLAAASVPQALLAGLLVAFVAAGFGAARAQAPWTQLGAMMSPRTRSVVAGTTGSLVILAAAGAMATALALASDVHKFSAVYQLLDPGVVGTGLLLLAQLAYLPNAVLWAIAYMLGPGFAVGVGTVVAPTGSAVGALPAFPLLAALPVGAHGAGPGWLAALMLAIPYLAGVAGGLLAVRAAPVIAPEAAAIHGFCCGLASGAILGVAAAFAGGPLGDGRLSAVGPSAWQVALVAALEVGIAAAVTAGTVSWWRLRAARPDQPAPGQPAGYRGYDRRAEDDGHVIYMDRWAADQDDGGKPRRSGGPSALP